MHVLMFEKRFWEPVAAGFKRHTIRGRRARPIVPGDELSLRRWQRAPYRSRQVHLLDNVTCFRIRNILIDEDPDGPLIRIEGGCTMHPAEADDFARLDGFADADELLAWHDAAHGLPFEGVLIEW
jgi:hypothetical protein